MKSEDIKVCVH